MLRVEAQGFIEEPWLDQITSTAGDHRHAPWLSELAAPNHCGVTPVKSSRHCCAAETKCRFGQPRAIMQISCKGISRINAVVIHHHDQGIFPAGCQLLLDDRNKLCGWSPVSPST